MLDSVRLVRIYPVIHYLDRATALDEVSVARNCGAAGVFLISHRGQDAELIGVAHEAKQTHPDFAIGINLLSRTPIEAARHALADGLDLVWADRMGVDSEGLAPEGLVLSRFVQDHPRIKFFAGVAFKYQVPESDPEQAARNALAAGFIPTTSGPATGEAPEVAKIRLMSESVNGQLAVASGMTPENVARYAPYLAVILVATGVSRDDHHIDPARLRLLIERAGRA
ncbi:MAG: BtpA/SgcQ family protein [Acidiferrobacterales bacterium]